MIKLFNTSRIIILTMLICILSFSGCTHKLAEGEVYENKSIPEETQTQTEIETVKELPQDYDLICSVVMNEAGAEPYDGMCAVTQCILNACKRENKPFSAIRNDYGYYYTKTPNSTVRRAVYDVYVNGYRVTDEPIICFYNPRLCRSDWHESQVFVCEIGQHRFFKFNPGI